MLEIKTINHYTLNLSEVKSCELVTNFQHVIYYDFSLIDDKVLRKIAQSFGEDKITALRYRFAVRHKMVVTFIDEEFASFCFFGDRPFKFSLFKLKDHELYFYDCFTFEEFRGRSSIYAEVRYVIEKYKDLGYEIAHVEIEDSNIPSKKAFAKLGFKKVRVYYVINIFGARIIFWKKVTS